jgi:aminoglycoside 6'-N-acetyltransferase
MIFCKNDKLTIRNLEKKDKQILIKWLTDDKVLQYYEGRDNPHNEEMVEESFYKDGDKTPCIIEYLGNPIGYIQFYNISEEEIEEYGYTNFQGSIFGTDQFIGEPKYWNQGIGKDLMKLMIEFLTKEKGAKKIVLDPQTWNERAIKCYESCGFKKVKLMLKHELHEGELKDCWIMEYGVSHREVLFGSIK